MPVEVLRTVHCNVNCADLERSLGFYRDRIGLVPLQHTNPLPQDGSGFGIAGEVQWDAWMLGDARRPDAPVLDLLEWKRPPPTGAPYAAAHHRGLHSVRIAVPDLGAVRDRLRSDELEAQSRDPGDPSRPPGVGAVLPARDPDGTRVELVAADPGADGGAHAGARLVRTTVQCADLAVSRDWYERVLGLEPIGPAATGPTPGEGLGPSGAREYETALLRAPGDDFTVALREWRSPRSSGTPYDSANHLGIYRLALLVADARASWRELRRAGVACPEPVFLDMGPDIPVEGVRAVFFADPDGACLELIEAPAITS